MVLSPRDSGEFITKNAQFVKVNKAGIDKLVNDALAGLVDGTVGPMNFTQSQLHPKPDDGIAIDWIFLVDTLNFCFWTPGNDTKWRVNDYTGYFALCAAVNRAIENGIDITNSSYYSTVNLKQLKNILRSDNGVTQVPLLEERVACLHEVGSKLIEKYDGKFENCIKLCDKSAQKLLDLIVREFPCFRDEADFKEQRVGIYKRAQILIGDIWTCYRGKGLGEFKDIDTITMFADYRVPQVLVHYGSMEYSSDLMDLLKADQLLKNGDREEVEIRGVSIYIVEAVKNELLKKIKETNAEVEIANVNSILLDHFLWDYRRIHAKELEHIPFHKVLSIYY